MADGVRLGTTIDCRDAGAMARFWTLALSYEEAPRTKEEELAAAGASRLREDRVGGNLDHLVMADPEGNEFCIV